MHVITRRRLVEFAAKHADAHQPLDDWYRCMKSSVFASPIEARAAFATADFLANNLTIFNIGGNKYRLSVTMRYDLGRVYVRRVMTHAEYDRRTRDGTL